MAKQNSNSSANGLSSGKDGTTISPERTGLILESAFELMQIGRNIGGLAPESGEDTCYLLRGIAIRVMDLCGVITSAISDELETADVLSSTVRNEFAPMVNKTYLPK